MVNVIKTDNVAVITGAGAGIGASAAKYFSELGMKLVLVDKNKKNLENVAKALTTEYQLIEGDISDDSILQKMHDISYETFGQVNILFNNAAISKPTVPWEKSKNWDLTMEINLLSILKTQEIFLPDLIKQDSPSAIVNLGSKEGITTPPGNVAYSISKAGVKILTEQLAHELRQIPNHNVSAHLLVPGYTWTPMNFPQDDFSDIKNKPHEPWSPDQLMEFFKQSIENDHFYIMALDNEVTEEIDARRMKWNVEDIIKKRPALSRWHNDYKDAFEEYLNEGNHR